MSDLDRALAWAREIQDDTDGWGHPTRAAFVARALLAEHERANTEHAMRLEDLEDVARLTDERDDNAAEARLWRAMRGLLMICEDKGFGPYWWLALRKSALPFPRPATVDAAVALLADQQEASHD